MKVILLQDIRGVGKKHDVKEVKDGHARNFLIPHELAKAATPENLVRLHATLKTRDEEDREAHARSMELAQLFKERSLTFYVKTNEEGTVYGSITHEDIVRALRDQGFVTKERVHVSLDHPLKTLGDHTVRVELTHGVTVELTVTLQQQQSPQ